MNDVVHAYRACVYDSLRLFAHLDYTIAVFLGGRQV